MNVRLRILFTTLLAVLYVALLGFFVYQCLLPANESSNASSTVLNIILKPIEAITGNPIERTESLQIFVRKFVGHYGYFVLLGLVSLALWQTAFLRLGRGYVATIHFSTGFLFAFISEFLLEANTLGRSADMIDVLIDYAGFITLSLPVFLFLFFKRKRKDVV